jgi:hypothetical protein
VNDLAKYQLFALVLGILVTTSILILSPDSKQFLNQGQLSIISEKEKWLGINGKSNWKINGLQMLFFVSRATGIL